MNPSKLKWILGALCLGFFFLPPVKHWFEAYDYGNYYVQGLFLFPVSFLLSALSMPFFMRLGRKVGLLDHPDQSRKAHRHATPLVGGLSIYFAFMFTLAFNYHFSIQMKAIVVASTLIFLVGLLDDLFELSAWVRLGVQIIAASILVYFGVRVTFVPDYLGGVFTETVITITWLIGITNSLNFIDGIDGLAAGSCVIYCFFFYLVSAATGQGYMMFLVVAIAGSCLGFVLYNFRFAKHALAFLGDSGSTFLGFFLASIAILGEWGASVTDIAVPILVMSVLIFDMTLTTVVRIYTREVRTFGQWIHYTGRDHFHHRLSNLGLGNRLAAFIIFGVSICFGLEALALKGAPASEAGLILVHSILVFFILAVVLTYRKHKADASISVNGASQC